MTDSDGRAFHKDSQSLTRDPPIGFLSQESVRAFDSRMEAGICNILSIVVDIFLHSGNLACQFPVEQKTV